MAAPRVDDAKLSLELSCRNLARMDNFGLGKSDPYVEVLEYSAETGAWTEIGVTEVQLKELNPTFKSAISLSCAASDVSPLRFMVWDDDSGGKADKKKRDLIGSATITKFAIIHASQTESRQLHSTLSNENGICHGKLHVRVLGNLPADSQTSNRVLVSIGLKTLSNTGGLELMGLSEADSVQIEVAMSGQQSVDLMTEGVESSSFVTAAIPLSTMKLVDWQCDVSFWCDGRQDHEVQFQLRKHEPAARQGSITMADKREPGRIVGHGRTTLTNVTALTKERRSIRLLAGNLKDGMLDKDLSALRAAEVPVIEVELSVARNEDIKAAMLSNVYLPFDANHDGTMDLEELKALLAVRSLPVSGSSIARAFCGIVRSLVWHAFAVGSKLGSGCI